MVEGALIGLAVGLLIGFIDSYSYAISGYTTAEISLIIIPFLTIFAFKLFRVRYGDDDVVTAIAIAYGISVTTTLTSGMYITFGFLKHVSERLKAYGLAVSVPQHLFSGSFPDLQALPIYISLALLSFGGALVAFTFRGHFIEKERLKYPIGFAAAVLTKFLVKASLSRRSTAIAILIGFLAQLLAMRSELFLDLTPVVSTVVPGAILALSLWPIVLGLLILIPLDPLKMISAGSIATYLVVVPLAIAIFGIKVMPALSFEDALYSYSTIVIGLMVGVVFVLMLFYLLIYSRTLYSSLSMMVKLRIERAAFVTSIAMVSMLGYIATVLSGSPGLVAHMVPIVALHILLILVNLRVVGETGMGSQALLPTVTTYMYVAGLRDVSVYAVADPFTGIPMPQLVGGSAINLIRFSRFFKYNMVKLIALFGIGMLVGSFATYLYGNLLIQVYGFESQYMPLTRWIPTVVWMSAVYSGKLGVAPLASIVLGLAIGLALVVLGLRSNAPLFPFVVGMTMPPDIGVLSLLVYIVKRVLIRLGVEVHEKTIVLSVLFLIGCSIAVVFNTLLTILMW